MPWHLEHFVYSYITEEASSLKGISFYYTKTVRITRQGVDVATPCWTLAIVSHFWPCFVKRWLSVWPAVLTSNSMWLAWNGTWTHGTARSGWRRCTAPTRRTSATPGTTRTSKVVRLKDDISGRSTGSGLADLALRAHLPHQDCEVIKNVIQLCLCFLLRKKKIIFFKSKIHFIKKQTNQQKTSWSDNKVQL